MKIRAIKIVALFDILGIKERMDVDGILTDYERLISFVDQQTGCLVIRSVPAGEGGFCPAVGYLEVQQAYFSDTFILWMDYDAFRHSLRCAAIFSATAFHLESQFEAGLGSVMLIWTRRKAFI